MKKIKSLIAVLLSAVFAAGILPLTAFANGEPQNAQSTVLCGSVKNGVTDNNVTGYNPWQELVLFEDGQTEKTVVLGDDLAADSNDTALVLTSGKTLTLDLNGHTLDRGLGNKEAEDDGYVIKVNAGATLNVINSAVSEGVIKGGRSKNTGGGVIVEDGATFSISGIIKIADNYLLADKSNVCLGDNTVITVTGPIFESYIGVTKNVGDEVITSGIGKNTGNLNGYCYNFFSDSNKYVIMEDDREIFMLRIMTVSAVTEDENGDSVGDIKIEATTPIFYENVITLTAPPVAGYKFLGWFKDDEMFSAELKIQVIIREDSVLTAKYETISATKVGVTVKAANGAKFTTTIDGEEYYADVTFARVEIGTKITVTASDKDKVLQWENASGKIIGRGGSITFTVTSSTTVKLVYKAEGQNQAYVQFVSLSGQVVYADTFDETTIDSLVLPYGPTITCSKFEGWTIKNNGSEATAANIKALIQAGSTVITVEPVYSQQLEFCTVTVGYFTTLGESLAPGEIYTEIPAGTGYTVTARPIKDYKFYVWHDGTSKKILSYNAEYYFQVTGNTSLKAVYVSDPIVFDAWPIITISKARATNDGGAHKVCATATRSIPEGYTLVEHGMLYTKETFNNNDDFICGAAGVYKYVSNFTDLNGVVNLNVKPASDNDVVSMRGYMILSKNNTQETYYSEVVSGSYSGLTSNS